MKSDSRAAKVALMKLKMKAVGDKSIPQVDRADLYYAHLHLTEIMRAEQALIKLILI